MLYESTYNQYFLEHSWGPWKKHIYISRDGESGKFTYKYPREYYDKYRDYQTKKAIELQRTPGSFEERYGAIDKLYSKSADKNSEYYNEYYNTDIDKVINRSVKAAVKALNFSVGQKDKAEGYLNRFGNAVANAWTSAKSSLSSSIQAGKNFVSDLKSNIKGKITVQRISASVQNLIKGAGEAVSKGWNRAKDVADKAVERGTSKRQKISKGDDKLKDKINRRGPWYGH